MTKNWRWDDWFVAVCAVLSIVILMVGIGWRVTGYTPAQNTTVTTIYVKDAR